ncbi:hypothetical protein Aperf_G00000063714 [Anoplocephala perfoliata]
MQPVNSSKRSRPHLKVWHKPRKSVVLNQQISDLVARRSLLNELDDCAIETFSRFPLSDPTLRGLKESSFFKPTAVQKKSLKHILLGKDVVIQSKTGSGKTLAFVIPVLEYIFIEKITSYDGPIAVVLTPTRELAKQIFAVFHRVGKFHSFTMIDIMGGKTRTGKREEWQRAAKANIIIGTPGRFAQHQHENPTLDMSNLHFLILDEVDRLLDPTFRNDLLSIADNLSSDRQCLLFSATLSKKQCDLTALGLKSPIMISMENKSVGATPAHLIQSYSVMSLGKKLDYLWTFLQSHCKKKIIVFFSTQKQVRFVHDLFMQMRPFFSVMQLRGNMLQSKRFKIYEKFSQTRRGAALFATNVAERGLDFPEVDWVVQYDCPKQLDDYIHRVGRTARAERLGRSIMFLLPSEVKIIELLGKRNVHLRYLQFPESRVHPVVTNRAPALLASQPELAASARTAFTAYLRDYCFIPKMTISIKGNQTLEGSGAMSLVFQPDKLPVDEFASSLGLAMTPELPKEMLKYAPSSAGSTSTRKPLLLLAKDKSQQEEAGFDADENESDYDGDFLQRKAFSVLRPELKAKVEASGKKFLEVITSSDESDHESSDEEEAEHKICSAEQSATKKKSLKKRPLTRIQQAKKELRRNIRTHMGVVYDAEGKPVAKYIGGVLVDDLDAKTESTTVPARLNIEAERERLRSVVDAEDKARWRALIREKHRAERKKAKEARKAERAATTTFLPNSDEEEDHEADDAESEYIEGDPGERQDEDMGDVEYSEESVDEDKQEEPPQKRSRNK